MSRDALVVGINKYPFLKKNGKAQNLTTPASDAEAIVLRTPLRDRQID